MAKFISLVTTSLKPPFYNDIIKIIPYNKIIHCSIKLTKNTMNTRKAIA